MKPYRINAIWGGGLKYLECLMYSIWHAYHACDWSWIHFQRWMVTVISIVDVLIRQNNWTWCWWGRHTCFCINGPYSWRWPEDDEVKLWVQFYFLFVGTFKSIFSWETIVRLYRFASPLIHWSPLYCDISKKILRNRSALIVLLILW